MHQPMIRSALGCVDESRLQLTGLTTLMWGRDMTFAGLCVPPEGKALDFRLESVDCREVKWQLFSHHHLDEPIPFPITEIVSFKIGQSHHRKSATILTDHFGLTWNYKTLNLQYDGHILELD